MRVDKFLKNSRIIKRRTMAKEACQQGRVFINDKLAKPGDLVAIGDKIRIVFGNGQLDVEVLDLKEHVGKNDAGKLYREI